MGKDLKDSSSSRGFPAPHPHPAARHLCEPARKAPKDALTIFSRSVREHRVDHRGPLQV